jgi:uncharacterized Zn-finger protein
MVESSIPYFHNNPGVPRVRVRAKEFMCIGDLPPFDHPHIFIDMGDDNEIVCPYCSTLFVYDPHLEGACEPPECAFHPESVPEPAPPPTDISIVTAPPQPEPTTPARQKTSIVPAVSIETTSAGMAASFATEAALASALERLRAADVGGLDTYTPKPVDGTPAESRLPVAIFAFGLFGFAAGFGMEVYANTIGYPLDIG